MSFSALPVAVFGSALVTGLGSSCAPAAVCQPSPQPGVHDLVILDSSPPPHEIWGVLYSLPDSTPLQYALVSVRATKAGAMTTDDGHFRLRGVTSGSKTLEVRHVGYWTLAVPITIPTQTGLAVRAGVGRSCAEIEA